MPISRLDLPGILGALDRFFRAVEVFPELPKTTPKLADAHDELLRLLMPSGVDYNFRHSYDSDVTRSDLDLEAKAILKDLLSDYLSPEGMYNVIQRREKTLLQLRSWIQNLGGGKPEPIQTSTVALREPLTSWHMIAAAVGKGKGDKQFIMGLNKLYVGPIKIGAVGKRPFVYKDELLRWWDQMTINAQDAADRRNGRKLSAKGGHAFGKDGTAIPEIGGGVRNRRRPKLT